MKTNLGKTKEEIIYEIFISLNQGNCGSIACGQNLLSGECCYDPRVKIAKKQYQALIDNHIIIEEE